MNDPNISAASVRQPSPHRLRSIFARLAGLFVLTSCGGGGGGGNANTPSEPAPLTVGGSLSGLAAGSIVLQLNGGERLTLLQDGPFAFATPLQIGQPYTVSVVTPPVKTFTELTRNTGFVTGDVRDVAVTVTPAYQVRGTVSDLHGRMVLELNGEERIALEGAGDTPFVFNTLLRDGANYSVTLIESPGTGPWLTSNPSGQVAAADVTSVAVYREAMYTIGGTASGLLGGLVLRNNGTDDLVVGTDGPFTFGRRQLAGTTYDVQVLFKPASQRVRVLHGAGNVSNGNVTSVEVVCEEKAWTHPATVADTISPAGNDADNVWVGSGLRGDAVVAWEYGSGIYASERRDGAWIHPERDVTPPHNPVGGSSFDPRVAVDPRGDVLLAWAQRDVATSRIYASVRRNGVWRDPVDHGDHLSPAAQDAQRPRVVVDVTGTGHVVWEQYVNGNGRIFKSTYRDGVWSNPTSPDDRLSPDTTHAQDVQIAVAPSGHVIVVWSQSDNHDYRIFKSELRDGTWTHPASLDDGISPAGADAYAPDVAFDGSGNAVIAWVQSDGAHAQVFKAELRGDTWSYPASLTDNISADGWPVHGVSVAMSRHGDAVILWRQDLSATASGLFKSEYRGGAWTHPASLSDVFSLGTTVAEFAASLDSEGNTVVAYTATSGASLVLLKSEFRRGQWQHPTALSDRISPPGGEVTQPCVTVDGNDDVLVTWRQDDGTNRRAFLSEYR